ncbi:MbtH family protein [Streptomyces sp. Z26]|uniref:MbtH family protein n=1 Tax=Streptomyces TaxID=1883 RepID=UPI000EF150A4|nr:MbtH family protein [Streptomyces sp. Z26]RLL69276.1 MbtH family protein [Streptomyces sp. Z26]
MANPFEDESARYLVLVNHEDRYSLWPAALAVPAGWRVALGETDRAACLAYVDRHFTVVLPRAGEPAPDGPGRSV